MDIFEHRFLWGFIYFAALSIISVIVCVSDKQRARRGKWRVSEAALFTLSLLGGAVAMLFTMKSIHHKTRHKRFMIGLPLIIILQLAVLIFTVFVLDKKIL